MSTIRNTNTNKLIIQDEIRSSVQNGTAPSGATAGSSKFPLNVSIPILDNPNISAGGIPYHTFPVAEVNESFVLKIYDDWSYKIKAGGKIVLKRGSIKKTYTVKSLFFDHSTTHSIVTLFSAREETPSLDSFLGPTGYPITANDTVGIFNVTGENPNLRENLLVSFDAQMLPTQESTFSLVTSWEIDPKVSATRLRWRSVPSVKTSSNLNFSIGTVGKYYQVPSVSVISESGRSAQVQLSSSIDQISVSLGGSGYTTASAYAVGGGGTGASFSVSLVGNSVSSVNVISGGSGYISTPQIVIEGNGSGADVQSVMIVDTIYNVQQGGGYLRPPSVTVDPTHLYSTTPTSIDSALVLTNTGSIDYIRVLEGGIGYTGASVTVTGSSTGDDAIASAVINEDGFLERIDILHSGSGYTSGSVTIIPDGTGSSATAVANVDLYSSWVYEDPLYTDRTKTITGLKPNILYEIQLLVSDDEYFRGLISYSDSITFQYSK